MWASRRRKQLGLVAYGLGLTAWGLGRLSPTLRGLGFSAKRAWVALRAMRAPVRPVCVFVCVCVCVCARARACAPLLVPPRQRGLQSLYALLCCRLVPVRCAVACRSLLCCRLSLLWRPVACRSSALLFPVGLCCAVACRSSALLSPVAHLAAFRVMWGALPSLPGRARGSVCVCLCVCVCVCVCVILSCEERFLLCLPWLRRTTCCGQSCI